MSKLIHRSEHTPRPWHYNGISSIYAGKKLIVTDLKPFTDEGQANAKLIAAAPDMYEAIYNAITILAGIGGDGEKARKSLIKSIKSLG